MHQDDDFTQEGIPLWLRRRTPECPPECAESHLGKCKICGVEGQVIEIQLTPTEKPMDRCFKCMSGDQDSDPRVEFVGHSVRCPCYNKTAEIPMTDVQEKRRMEDGARITFDNKAEIDAVMLTNIQSAYLAACMMLGHAFAHNQPSVVIAKAVEQVQRAHELMGSPGCRYMMQKVMVGLLWQGTGKRPPSPEEFSEQLKQQIKNLFGDQDVLVVDAIDGPAVPGLGFMPKKGPVS